MDIRKNNTFLAELLGWSRDESDESINENGGNWWLTTDCARYIVATDKKEIITTVTTIGNQMSLGSN